MRKYSNIFEYPNIRYTLNDGNNSGQAKHGARKRTALRTQASWAKNVLIPKTCENNGQLCLRPPSQVVHANHMDQLFKLF